jgi:DNA-binding SARP family transcriptional activator
MESYGGKAPEAASGASVSGAAVFGASMSGAPVSGALVSVALAELRQLAREPLLADVERALLALGHNPGEHAGSGLDAVRQLRQRSAEYQRAALGLEAAARCCRLVEQEINQHADAILSANNKGLAGQFRDIFRRSRSAARNSARSSEPAPGPPGPGPSPRGPADSRPATSAGPSPRARTDTWPATSAGPHAKPAPVLPGAGGITAPDADIAASALGPLEVHVAGRRVPRWTSLKARSVFQYLLVHQDRPIRRGVLMSLQWPDHSHNSARNNLNVALYSLRNTLEGLGGGAQPIVYRDGCYSLNPELTWWIDRNEFLSAVADARRAHREDQPAQVIGAYRKAIGLYRGPLFEDDGDAEWYLPEQRRLQDLYGQALEGIADIHFRLGELAEAQEFGQRALGHDPCSESTHRLLMRCYASQHQQQLVSRQYRICADALRDELGVCPSDETTTLFHELI